MTISTYGIGFQKGDGGSPTETFTSVGAIVKMTIPEIQTDKKSSTTHATSGKATNVSSGLVGMSDFTVILDGINSDMAALYDIMLAKTISNYKIIFADATITPWLIKCFPLSIKPMDIDAQNPDVLHFETKWCVASFDNLAVSAAG